jgi:hypothetical protein
MKKIVLTILLGALLVPMGFSNDPGFRFGLKAAPSLSWMRPETRGYESEGVKLGFTYGVISDFSLGEFYAVSTGLQISSFGGKLKFPHRHDTFGDGERTREYSLRYLEIPLLLKMHTQEIGYITYFGQFGFSPGMNLRAYADDRSRYQPIGASPITITDDEVDIKGETPFFRLALVVGLGMEYSLGGRTALLGGLTFNNGFTNVLKGNNPVTGRKQSAVTNYLELTLGVMF